MSNPVTIQTRRVTNDNQAPIYTKDEVEGLVLGLDSILQELSEALSKVTKIRKSEFSEIGRIPKKTQFNNGLLKKNEEDSGAIFSTI